MGMRDVRSTFLAAAGNALRLEHASLTYSGPAQILKFTGWHDDGLPFVFVSAPFTGDPFSRAAEIAQDLIAAHTGTRPMPAPAPIIGLAATLREQLMAVSVRASKIGESAKVEVTNLNAVLDTAEGVVNDVKAAAADIQGALGMNTNGGPKIDPLAAPKAESQT